MPKFPLDTHWAGPTLDAVEGDRGFAMLKALNHLCMAAAISVFPTLTWGLENSVVIESKAVVPGSDSVRIAIWINNSVPIKGILLPLELRGSPSGAFVAGWQSLSDNPAGRVYNSPLSDDISGCWPFPFANPMRRFFPAPETTNDCSGPVSRSYGSLAGDGSPPFVSPDGHSLLAEGRYCGEMEAGADPAPPDSASFFFSFGVSEVVGSFEIDTACVWGHLGFEDGIVPAFVKGVINVCDCSCHADPACDSITNILDVVRVIDRAFRNDPVLSDASCPGLPTAVDGRTDVDCSGVTDIVDVVLSVNVAIRGAMGESVFCNACP